MADDDDTGVVGGGGSRRGSGSTGGYTGGGSDTDTGSGVTGDDGSDSTYGGGGGSDTTTGGATGGDDGSDDDSGVVGGGGDNDYGGGSDTTYGGGGSNTDAGSGSTGDDSTDTTFEGGGGDETTTQAPEGETGTQDPQRTRDTTPSTTQGGSDSPRSETPQGVDDQTLQDAERGASVTRSGTPTDGGQLQQSERVRRRERQRAEQNLSGLEEEYGALSGAEGRVADRVQQLQGRIDRETPVDAFGNRDAYAIRREGDTLTVEFADRIGQPVEPPPTEQRQQIAAQVAADREGVSPSDVTVTQTAEGFEATTRDGDGGAETVITGGPTPDRVETDVEVSESTDRGVGVTRGPSGTDVVVPETDAQSRQQTTVQPFATVGSGAGQPSSQQPAIITGPGADVSPAGTGGLGPNPSRREAYVAGVDVLLGSVDDAVARSLRTDNPIEAADALAGSTDEAIGRAARASAEGDRARAADNLAGGLDDAGADVTTAVSTLTEDTPGLPDDGYDAAIIGGPVAEAATTGAAIGDDVQDAEVNRDVTGRVTEGGLLSDRDEQRLSVASRQFNADTKTAIRRGSNITPLTLAERGTQTAADAAGLPAEIETSVETPIGRAEFDTERFGEGPAERTQEGAATTVATAANPFALAQAGETGVELTQNVPDEVEQGGTAAVGASALAVGRETGESIATDARTDPTQFAGSLAGEAVLGGAIGRGVGTVARRSTDRVRTAGGTEVDLEAVTNEQTAAFYRGETNVEEARFPSAEDPELYRSNPPEAVRQQAERYTPAAIEQRFEAAGVESGSDLKKALDTEPEGPDSPVVGDGAGFQAREGDYESPGGFAGPELSPNFLEVGDRSYSPVPGLPGLGGRPTGVVARTDVDSPDANTLDEFNRELADERAGETTVYTKPADTVSTGEIEGVVPPGARFQAVDSVASGGNRFGVGADFYTEVGGRRVPLRLVAPEDRVDVDGPSAAGSVDDVGGRPLSSYSRRAGDDVDRPSPTPSRSVSETSSRGASRPVSDSLSEAASETSSGSRATSRPVSSPVSSSLTTSSGFGSGSTPSRVGTPTGFGGYGSGGFESYNFEGFGSSEVTEQITTGDRITTSDITPETTPDPDPRPEIDFPEWEDREYGIDADTEPERFENPIATPGDFLF
jgi:hypothetical protein